MMHLKITSAEGEISRNKNMTTHALSPFIAVRHVEVHVHLVGRDKVG
jgi:hypothetical protein